MGWKVTYTQAVDSNPPRQETVDCPSLSVASAAIEGIVTAAARESNVAVIGFLLTETNP